MSRGLRSCFVTNVSRGNSGQQRQLLCSLSLSIGMTNRGEKTRGEIVGNPTPHACVSVSVEGCVCVHACILVNFVFFPFLEDSMILYFHPSSLWGLAHYIAMYKFISILFFLFYTCQSFSYSSCLVQCLVLMTE